MYIVYVLGFRDGDLEFCVIILVWRAGDFERHFGFKVL